MDSIIHDLYYGRLAPHERSFQENAAYKKALAKVTQHQEALLASLDDTQKGLFKNLSDAESALSGVFCQEFFADGFRLGALLMLDIFAET